MHNVRHIILINYMCTDSQMCDTHISRNVYKQIGFIHLHYTILRVVFSL